MQYVVAIVKLLVALIKRLARPRDADTRTIPPGTTDTTPLPPSKPRPALRYTSVKLFGYATLMWRIALLTAPLDLAIAHYASKVQVPPMLLGAALLVTLSVPLRRNLVKLFLCCEVNESTLHISSFAILCYSYALI